MLGTEKCKEREAQTKMVYVFDREKQKGSDRQTDRQIDTKEKD